MTEAITRPAWAEVDQGAVRANVGALRAACDPAVVCAVVKANGYGMGAVPMAEAALAGGAGWLAVALVEEGLALRDAGIDAPILLLSEPPPGAMGPAVTHRLTPTVYTAKGVEALAAAAVASKVVPVHVKVDTGMHRVGAAPEDAVAIAQAVEAAPGLTLEAVWTHLAVADEPAADATTAAQLQRFDDACAAITAAGIRIGMRHAANSAGAVAHREARLDLVRCGIAVYGYPPGPALDGRVALQPALSLKARVTHVRELPSGEGISYGHRYVTKEPTVVATIPLGYADGVPRNLGVRGGEVLIGGRRRPIAGTVTMDQLMIDCGPGADVGVGDEVVLLGRQGDDEVSPTEWAALLDTITYEVLCGIGPRVPRVYTAPS